jgi:hypothetical protein
MTFCLNDTSLYRYSYVFRCFVGSGDCRESELRDSCDELHYQVPRNFFQHPPPAIDSHTEQSVLSGPLDMDSPATQSLVDSPYLRSLIVCRDHLTPPLPRTPN